ncbi:hypothetical protein LTR91_004058 [Friedmanniomyces endolithicus]|uniref:F-box domain-containing protein n=1 Tax=Friedmanniomyces endolithicus TaxID=329885 RepID=A0AAN6KVV0_9PEZI|nr:hypothetical protein LTR57_002498 [Friedmanniomyces endolithicus]KAK1005046.1 hypothetical protein LTS01_003410 [Friedmanniomyces endolithicus]KAK1005202.1 hypothetical protein LTR91_004058 [Friedmanniomyces endolithicus]KAK1033321.1 hypothetical protein LTS16_016440 [Friedmanniomyces endolithicus]
MDTSRLTRLPDELLEAIVFYLPPHDTVAFGATCRRSNKITFEPLVWRAHCLQEYRYWESRHELKEKLSRPPAQTKWRLLFNERMQTDKKAADLFDALLETQQHRLERMEKVAAMGYDVKELLLKQRDGTPDEALDVLARRYHANALLGSIHRATALEKWTRLQNMQMVRLEEVLGAYDLFVLAGSKGDLSDMDRELDRIAESIRSHDPDFDTWSVRQKATEIARWLRAQNLVGNPSEDDYHALRNNFISIALFDEPHTSLPLQSVAIYCAVARRLGVNAKPSNYPHHVHAVIEASADTTLDAQHAHHLGPSTTLEIALRTSRNIMNSVQEVRQRNTTPRCATYPDVDAAWYSMLWSMLVLSDSNTAALLHRRRQILPYLVEHYQAHFPEDLNLLETLVAPMFESLREHHVLMHLITTARAADANQRAPSRRPNKADLRAFWIPGQGGVRYRIGTYFKHRRYHYEGVVVGWDTRCAADPRWMEQMQVDSLPRGREQPFYNVLADDKSVRYVADENIESLSRQPSEAILALAGRYFKRWDGTSGMFVSNIREEYPDD